jgi:cytochrome P450
MEDNHAASRSGQLARTAEVAARFDVIIRRLIDVRRAAGATAPDDVTTELLRLRDNSGKPLSDEVLVSVLRNWTGGDLSSIALCVGVLVHRLAGDPDLPQMLRRTSSADVDAAIDESLRIDDPFVSNRRVVAVDTEIRGCRLNAGDRVTVNWTAANRDPVVFGDPDAFDPERNRDANLVYGAGLHVCPGRPLATMELRVLARELVNTGVLQLLPGGAVERELPPVGGYRRLDVVLSSR